MTSATSWPYAPTFWIGVAPTDPGIPESASMPAMPCSTQNADERVPLLARGDVEPDPPVAALRLLDAARRDPHDRPGEPLVGDDDVAAAREDEHRLAGLVGRPHVRDELVLGGGLDEPARRTAQSQRRELAQGRGSDIDAQAIRRAAWGVIHRWRIAA